MMEMKTTLITDLLKMHPVLAQLYRDNTQKLPDTGLPPCPATPGDIIDFASKRRVTEGREELSREISHYLQQLDAPQESLQNARTLGKANTFTVVTGHQPVLFGGQLFLILKICSAIQTARILNEQDKSNTYIPIFWNASEDHNATEYLRTSFFDQANDLKTFKINGLPAHTAAENIPSSVAAEILQEISGHLPQSEFLAQLLADLRETMQGSIGESFSRLLLKWFGKYGLVIIEPKILRKLPGYADILSRALGENTILQRELNRSSSILANAGFTPQLPYNQNGRTMLFYLGDNGTRQRILVDGDRYYTADNGLNSPREQLLEQIKNKPENFSPVAALRPVIQSALLPVATYIAGGGELSYHFQLAGIFQHMQTPLPPLLPRPGGTILKNAITRYLDKSGFAVEDILSNSFSFSHIQQQGEENFREVTRAFWDMLAAIENSGRQLEYALTDAGIKSTSDWKKEKERFYERLEGLNKRYIDQNPAIGKNASASFNKAHKYLLPADGYQDNSCWFIYFYCLFGGEISDTICSKVNPFSNMHHVFIPEFNE